MLPGVQAPKTIPREEMSRSSCIRTLERGMDAHLPSSKAVNNLKLQSTALDASDLMYLAGYCADLRHSNPEIVRNAQFHLSMFEKRAASLV